MKVHWTIYLVAGILLTCVLMISAIGIYNMVIYKIPLSGQQIQTTLPELNTVSRPVNVTTIAPDDPIREQLFTEDEAWDHAWAFLHDRIGFSVFLPIEKQSNGLHQVTDDLGNQYVAWEFSVMQKERPFIIFSRFTRGGEIFIDARDGHVIWYAGYV
jgi:hypothetical protein